MREPPAGRQAELPFSQGLRLAWPTSPFRRLILAFFLNGIANGLPATLFLLFVRHVLGADVDAGPLLLLYFVSGMLAVPGWLWLSYRMGKHRTWSLAMLWACVMFAWVPFLGPGDVRGLRRDLRALRCQPRRRSRHPGLDAGRRDRSRPRA